MPEDWIALAASAPVQDLQLRGLLQPVPHRHATKHFHQSSHPIIEGYDPPEAWGWCYVDEVFFDLSDRATPQLGPIPRYY